MIIFQLSIDADEPEKYTMNDFITHRVAHQHLFKHVLGAIPGARSTDTCDPEKWEDIIPNPPLDVSMMKRRKQAAVVLQQIPDCLLNTANPLSYLICRDCINVTAQVEVSHHMKSVLHAYARAAHDTFNWCLKYPEKISSRFVSYRELNSKKIRIIATDNAAVRSIFVLDTQKKSLHIISCYRMIPKRSYREVWLDLQREQSGYRHQMIGVTISGNQVEETHE